MMDFPRRDRGGNAVDTGVGDPLDGVIADLLSVQIKSGKMVVHCCIVTQAGVEDLIAQLRANAPFVKDRP